MKVIKPTGSITVYAGLVDFDDSQPSILFNKLFDIDFIYQLIGSLEWF